MTKKAILVLADSLVYQGQAFGAETAIHGEGVFNGINESDFEFRQIQLTGLVVRSIALNLTTIMTDEEIAVN